MKKTILYLLFVVIFMQLAMAAPSVIRELPSSVDKGETFTVTYKVSGVSGTWGVIIEDDISGGCNQAILGTNLDFAWTSEEGLTNTKTITAPGSAATCVFEGSFLFGTSSGGAGTEIDFQKQTVTVGDGGEDDNDDDEDNGCEFYESLKDDGTCGIAVWVWFVVGGIFLLAFFGGKRR